MADLQPNEQSNSRKWITVIDYFLNVNKLTLLIL